MYSEGIRGCSGATRASLVRYLLKQVQKAISKVHYNYLNFNPLLQKPLFPTSRITLKDCPTQIGLSEMGKFRWMKVSHFFILGGSRAAISSFLFPIG